MPNCASCQAEILWVTTTAGRKMPLDPTPDADKGNVFVQDDGVARVLGGDNLEEARASGARLFCTHFVTCPGAGKHRKK